MSASEGLHHTWIVALAASPDEAPGAARTKIAANLPEELPPSQRSSHSEDGVKAYGQKVATDIVQTLLTCKELYARNEKAPLSDDEYDRLMGDYADLINADTRNLFDQLEVFRSGVGQIRAAARLYDAKTAAMKRGSHEVAGSIRTLDDREYDQTKANVKKIGDGLVRKLKRLHRDPLLKSAVPDADYDRLVRERRKMDTVAEEAAFRSEISEIPDTCNEIYLRLVEVDGYREAFASGKVLVQSEDYKLKRLKAIAAAEAFLSSDDSNTVPTEILERILDRVKDGASSNTSTPNKSAECRVEVASTAASETSSSARRAEATSNPVVVTHTGDCMILEPGESTPDATSNSVVVTRAGDCMILEPAESLPDETSDSVVVTRAGDCIILEPASAPPPVQFSHQRSRSGPQRVWQLLSSLSTRPSISTRSQLSNSSLAIQSGDVADELELPQINVGA
jgi:hypothetical protein